MVDDDEDESESADDGGDSNLDLDRPAASVDHPSREKLLIDLDAILVCFVCSLKVFTLLGT